MTLEGSKLTANLMSIYSRFMSTVYIFNMYRSNCWV